MLLVDDHEPEIGEVDVLLQQSVGSDDDARLAGDNVEQCLRARRGRHRSREERDARAVGVPAELPALREVAQHGAHRRGVLRREHLRGREEGCLCAGVDDGEHRSQRHDRLTRADLTLEQSVHGHLTREVVGDGGTDLDLPRRQLERESAVEAREQTVRARDARRRGYRASLGPALREHELSDERLVEAETLLRRAHVRHGARQVRGAHGTREIGHAHALTQVVVERVGQGADRVEHLLDRQRQTEVRDLLDLLVDRHEAVLVDAHVSVVHERVLRVGELQLLSVEPQLTAEEGSLTRPKNAVVRVRTEERDERAPARVVDDDGVGHGTAPVLHAPLRHLRHLGGENDVLAEFELREAAAGVGVDVAARKVVQEVADRLEVARLREFLRARAEHLDEGCLERHVTHGSLRVGRGSPIADAGGRPRPRRVRPRLPGR